MCGNYRTGVSFPDCVNFGYDMAGVVAGYLSTRVEGAGGGERDEDDDDRARVRKGIGGERGRNRPDPPSFLCFALNYVDRRRIIFPPWETETHLMIVS